MKSIHVDVDVDVDIEQAISIFLTTNVTALISRGEFKILVSRECGRMARGAPRGGHPREEWKYGKRLEP